MFKKIIESVEIIKNVLRKINYFILFVCVSLILFIIFYFLTLATVTYHSLEIFIMMNGGFYTLLTFVLLAFIAFLFGVYVSLVVFRIKSSVGKSFFSGIFGGGGLVTGLFGAGCPMCGAFLFGLLGFPLALFFMPFKGIELRLASLVLMLVSIYFVSRGLDKCKIKLKIKK